jgi:hypothetical protein
VAAGEEGEKSREWWEDSQLRERGKREKGKRKMRARILVKFCEISKSGASSLCFKVLTCPTYSGQPGQLQQRWST